MEKINSNSSTLVVNLTKNEFTKLCSKELQAKFSSLTDALNNEAKNETFGAVVLNFANISDDKIDKLLKKVFTLLQQDGLIIILNCELSEVKLSLKVNGYIDVTTDDIYLVGHKPKYEVGSSQKINVTKSNSNIANVWKLSDTIDDDIDTIDPDDLLDEEDLQKPHPSVLRVCGTTGVRKACKNCSCGLAEELENKNEGKEAPTVRSSCGNCYLGDAFRCAACPYLGMPAFKPGEKIELSSNQLVADN